MQRVIITNTIQSDLLAAFNDCEHDRTFILTDETTRQLCWPMIKDFPYLADAHLITIGASDINKTLQSTTHVWEELQRGGATRHSLLINLGGGMVTDLGGFAASTFKRGINFINIPTTLLAMVDASVGGKTGINFGSLKNEIGVFNDSKYVLLCTDFLQTLDDQNLFSGYAEMLKHGLISTSSHWNELISFDITLPDSATLARLLATSVAVKERIVTEDPHEHGIRKALNLGHTVGHAIENRSGYRVPHGMAVAAGMCVITRAAENLSFAEKGTTERLLKVIRGYGLPDGISALACYTGGDLSVFSAESLSESAMNDKKASGSGLTLVVPERAGECALRTIKKEEFIDWLRAGGVK
jgi:3-dehydroquinate synthase